MHNLPQQLKTRADYDRAYAMAMSGHCDCRDAIPHFVGLLNSRYRMIFDRVLEAEEAPDGPEPDYRVLESTDEVTGNTVRQQYQRVERAESRMSRLGYTVAELTNIITDLEAQQNG